MKIKSAYYVVALVLSTINFQLTVFAQGTLTPPGAPAPTMKSLSQIEPRTPISSLPYFISSAGSYYVTSNLNGSSGFHGIYVSSGNVTIDLNGFTLTGGPGVTDGIFINGTYTNIIVRNGTITGWGSSGVDSVNAGGAPRNMVFENLTVSANSAYGIITEAGSIVRECLSTSNYLAGIYSKGGEIDHCLTRGNGSRGIDALNCVVRDCVAENCLNNYGFLLTQSSAIDCQSQNNYYGFYLSQSRMLNCVSENNNYGVYADTGANEMRGNVFRSNTNGIVCNPGGTDLASDNYVANSVFTGFFVSASGCQILNNTSVSNGTYAVFIQGVGNRIDNNNIVTVSGNAGIFINGVSSSNNVVTRNNVYGNGVFGYNIPVGNDLGPIGNASTNMSPWANFSH